MSVNINERYYHFGDLTQVSYFEKTSINSFKDLHVCTVLNIVLFYRTILIFIILDMRPPF